MSNPGNPTDKVVLDVDVTRVSPALDRVANQADTIAKKLTEVRLPRKLSDDIETATAGMKTITNMVNVYTQSLTNFSQKVSIAAQRQNAITARLGTNVGKAANELRVSSLLVKDAASIMASSDTKIATSLTSAREAATLYQAKLQQVARTYGDINAKGSLAGTTEAHMQQVALLEQQVAAAAELLLIQKQLTNEERATNLARKAAAGERDKTISQQVYGLQEIERLERKAAAARDLYNAEQVAGLKRVEAEQRDQALERDRFIALQVKGLREVEAIERQAAAARDLYNQQQVVGLKRVEAEQREAAMLARQSAAAARREAQPVGAFGGRTLTQRFGSQALSLGNFAILGGALAGTAALVSQVVKLDEALHNLQAIVQTSDSSILVLRAKILEVSAATKFLSSDLADAATVLGQAGLSVAEIGSSLGAVAVFAQATGIKLEESVNLLTSAMGAFNMRADESMIIANLFTAALNQSKLTVQQLSAGFQYSATAAAQLGIPIEELTTAMALMANAGIKSGSIIGTGLRQVFNQIANPSTKFQQILRSLGITLNDVDLQSHGFINVMMTLKEHGFDAAEAFRAFGTRGAGAFIAIQSQIGTARELEAGFVGTQAATKAAATQMESFANTARNAGAAISSLASTAFGPMLTILTSVISGVASFAQMLQSTSLIVQSFIVGIGVLGTVKLVQFVASLGFVTTALELMSSQAALTSAAMALLNTVLAPEILLIAAVTAGIVGLTYVFNAHTAAVEENRNAAEEAVSKYQNLRKEYGNLTDATQDLIVKEADLKKNKDQLAVTSVMLGERFGNLGLSVAGLGENVRNLTADYDTLLGRMRAAGLISLQQQQGALLKQRDTARVDYQDTVVQARRAAAELQPYALRAQGTGLPMSPGLEALVKRFSQPNAEITAKDAGALQDASRQLSAVDKDTLTGAQKSVLDGFRKVIDSAAEVSKHLQTVGNTLRDTGTGLDANKLATSPQFQAYQTKIQTMVGRINQKGVAPELKGIDKFKDYSDFYDYSQKVQKELDQAKDEITRYRKADPAHALAADVVGLLQMVTNASAALKSKTADLKAKADLSMKHLAENETAISDLSEQNSMKQLHNAKTPAEAATAKASLNAIYDAQWQAEAKKVAQDKLNLLPQQYNADAETRTLRIDPKAQRNFDTEQQSDLDRFNKEMAFKRQTQLDEMNNKMDHAQRWATGASLSNNLTTTRKSAAGEKTQIADELGMISKGSSQTDIEDHLKKATEILDQWYSDQITILEDDVAKAKNNKSPIASKDVDTRLSAIQEQYVHQLNQINAKAESKAGAALNGEYQNTIKTLSMSMTTIMKKIASQFKAMDQHTPREVVQSGLAEILEELRRWFEAAKAKLKKEIMQSQLPGHTPMSQEDQDSRLADITDQYESKVSDAKDQGKTMLESDRPVTTMGGAMDSMQEALRNKEATGSPSGDFINTFKSSMVDAIGYVRQNMGQMWVDFATGAKSAGDAAKDFAKGLLETIAKTLADKATEQLLGMFSDMFGGGGGGDFLAGLFGSSQGGVIPAYAGGGLVRGGVKGRDSVVSMARSGDFIMRQSAVSKVGVPFLDSISGYAMGGRVAPVKLMPGEYHINRHAARSFGYDRLKAINAAGNTYTSHGAYAAGGTVMNEASDRMAGRGHKTADPFGGRMKPPEKKHQTTNVWVVTPDQVPQMGPNDVLATVSDNIRRNGQIKQLIRSVSSGG